MLHQCMIVKEHAARGEARCLRGGLPRGCMINTLIAAGRRCTAPSHHILSVASRSVQPRLLAHRLCALPNNTSFVSQVRHRRRATRREMDRPTEVPAVPEAPNPTITGHVRVPLSLIAARVACGLPPPLLLPGVGDWSSLHEFALHGLHWYGSHRGPLQLQHHSPH
jgi:hypothetical protein